MMKRPITYPFLQCYIEQMYIERIRKTRRSRRHANELRMLLCAVPEDSYATKELTVAFSEKQIVITILES